MAIIDKINIRGNQYDLRDNAAQAAIAPLYSTSATYAVGDYVMHDGAYYVCKTAIATPESWTAGHWMQTNVGAEAGGLKSAIVQFGMRHINMFNPDTITEGKYLDANGTPSSNAAYFCSDFIDVSNLEKVRLSYTHIAHWYKADKSDNGAISGMNTISADAEVDIPENTVYMRFSTENRYLTIAQVGQYIDRNDYVSFAKYRLPDFIPDNDGVQIKFDLLNYTPNGNIFNPYNVVHNYYINPENGKITYSSVYTFGYSPTFVPVYPGENICSNIRAMLAYYDKNLNLLGGFQFDNTKTTTIPDGVYYIQISGNVTDFNTVVVMRGTTASSLGAYSFKLYGLDTSEEIITVDVGGSGNYTSLTQAVYENVDNGKTIKVMPGVYDVKAEYITLFGQTVVDNLADATSGINNFQYGIRIHDRKIVFMPGSKVVCDWTGKTIDGTHRFCAFRVEPGAEIEGLYLVCTATFYGIHDDYGPATPFTIKYKNCRIDCYSLYNANCIGGGCNKYSRHIIENCYFNNHVTSTDKVLSADVRYHNTNTADAEPEIFISNCFFSNNFNAAYYGNQTTKMKVYVNNCYAPKGINKVRESSTMNVDNVDLYKWNNEETE